MFNELGDHDSDSRDNEDNMATIVSPKSEDGKGRGMKGVMSKTKKRQPTHLKSATSFKDSEFQSNS